MPSNHNPSLEKPGAILLIGSWSSECSACRRGAKPSEKEHTTALGYFAKAILDDPDHPARKGCGARFVAVTSVYRHDEGIIEAVKQMRPDLPYTDKMAL